MKNKLTFLFLFLSTIASAQSDTIQTDRIITNAQMISVGSVNLLDTYLSPEHYTGTDIRFISHTTRELQEEGQPELKQISYQLVHQGNLSFCKNRADNGNEIAGAYDFQFVLHYNWNWRQGSNCLNLKVGGMTGTNIGFIYNTQNSNNPAQARAAVYLGPSSVLSYKFDVRKFRFVIRYEASFPMLGLMFSPNYGQSYYEIFSKGNYDHNIVVTTPFSAPSFRNMLSADINLHATTIRIGYLGDFQQADVNNLKSHIYTHAFMIGFVRKFKYIKLRP